MVCSNPMFQKNLSIKTLILNFSFEFKFKIMFITGDKLVRAIELVKLLSLEKSVRAAIQLVTKLKLPNLAERFNTILEVITNYIIFMTQNTCNSTFYSAWILKHLCFCRKDCLKKPQRLCIKKQQRLFKETTVKKETLAKTFTSPEISKTPEPVNEIKSVSHQKSARL